MDYEGRLINAMGKMSAVQLGHFLGELGASVELKGQLQTLHQQGHMAPAEQSQFAEAVEDFEGRLEAQEDFQESQGVTGA